MFIILVKIKAMLMACPVSIMLCDRHVPAAVLAQDVPRHGFVLSLTVRRGPGETAVSAGGSRRLC